MHYLYGNSDRCQACVHCMCPYLGGSVMGGYTVCHIYMLHHQMHMHMHMHAYMHAYATICSCQSCGNRLNYVILCDVHCRSYEPKIYRLVHNTIYLCHFFNESRESARISYQLDIEIIVGVFFGCSPVRGEFVIVFAVWEQVRSSEVCLSVSEGKNALFSYMGIAIGAKHASIVWRVSVSRRVRCGKFHCMSYLHVTPSDAHAHACMHMQ